jgi:hypothetical protein
MTKAEATFIFLFRSWQGSEEGRREDHKIKKRQNGRNVIIKYLTTFPSIFKPNVDRPRQSVSVAITAFPEK